MNNGSIKVITGIRRCGKSVLLFDIFGEYLLQQGIDEGHIIKFAFDSEDDLEKIGENMLDLAESKRKVDPHKFSAYIKSKLTDDGKYYLLLDEVQQLGSFETVLNGYLYKKNLDVYVTGSNSKFLSSDILTEFRGRGDEVRVYPLSFSEFYSAKGGDKYDAWDEYHLYGGMPALFERNTEEQKIEYLKTLMSKVYLSDIVERNHVQYPDEMDSIVDFLCSAIGSLTNPKKISDTLKSIKGKSISDVTAKNYLGYLTDAFLFAGVKAALDGLLATKSCCFSQEPLLHCQLAKRAYIFNCSLMAAAPGHSFVKKIIGEILSEKTVDRPLHAGSNKEYVFDTTGQWMLSRLYDGLPQREKDDVYLIPASYLSPYNVPQARAVREGRMDRQLADRYEGDEGALP